MESLNITSTWDNEAIRAACTTARNFTDALPPGSFLAGALGLGWLFNRWLTDRALNNGNALAEFDWMREIIVVTGGSGGIGAEIVKTLAARGSRVVVLDVLPLSYPKSPNVYYYKCDLTNYDELQAMATRIRKDLGDPTVVVANAGICRGKPILAASQRDIELTFSVNNLAMLWTAKTFLPNMISKNHGHLLIVASQTGYVATPGLTDYSATKAAAIAIYEGLHAEVKNIYKAPSVRVSCVSPSAVDTKMFSGIKLGLGMKALRPEDLGALIADILHGGRSKHTIVPRSASVLSIVRALPDWIRVAMQTASVGVFTDLHPHDPMKGQ
ncbi:short chain dehydrogenase reductase [Grosmannia clavigera kw1407]|uniref:Short chain dehydrogenase reductase n=1 Tax=Grosmannia clavigera (strain kw1407 / UAMH 11150) TaxID=655863 RepID=F0XNL9_GROCL|nr:short chain dehydrogenase reductase [Grosmannia clavigera kw1407]EFX00667.1 short chain dehydrogenase reductase [Grosmannia clavigera kw1407]